MFNGVVFMMAALEMNCFQPEKRVLGSSTALFYYHSSVDKAVCVAPGCC